MNSQLKAELRLKRDFSKLLTLVVVLAVMFLLLRGWNEQTPTIDKKMAYIMQGRLVASVNLVRASWMQQGRSKEIFWSTPESESALEPSRVRLKVNRNGWPDPARDCDQWWSLLMGNELSGSGLSISGDGKRCWVSFHSQPFLRYDSPTGSVILLSEDE